mgnify:CR=1 FL=1|jgi:hypothetical protein
MNVEANIKKEKFTCRDVIGVRGLCDIDYPYNLDSLGISLSKTSKLADSSMITGRELVQESVEFAWQQVMKDLRIDGFMVNGVRRIYTNKFIDDDLVEGVYRATFNRECDIEKLFFNWIKLNVSGTLNVTISVVKDGVETILFSDDVVDEKIKVSIDNTFLCDELTFKVVAIGVGMLQKTSDNGVIEYLGNRACSDQLFYCKYWEYLVQAVMYKAAAVILNSSIFSDRYNDLIIYQKSEIAIRVAQLDSSYNLLNGENRLASQSLYQAEIENINLKLKDVIKKSRCQCCFECDNYLESKITLP